MSKGPSYEQPAGLDSLPLLSWLADGNLWKVVLGALLMVALLLFSLAKVLIKSATDKDSLCLARNCVAHIYVQHLQIKRASRGSRLLGPAEINVLLRSFPYHQLTF